MDLRVLHNAGNFLTSTENASLLRISLPLGVSQLGGGVVFVCFVGRTIAQAVSRLLPPRRLVFYPSSIHVGLMVDKLALGKVSSEYIGFPCQFSFHQTLNNQLSSGAGTIGQFVTDISRFSHITP
jgi:hypothetical protein